MMLPRYLTDLSLTIRFRSYYRWHLEDTTAPLSFPFHTDLSSARASSSDALTSVTRVCRSMQLLFILLLTFLFPILSDLLLHM
jgi:hypothetical protein